MENPRLAVERFLRDGPTDEEKAAFVDTALALLTQKSLAYSAASDSLGDVLSAVTAVRAVFNTINAKFNSSTYIVWAMTNPNLFMFFKYTADWGVFGARWDQGLRASYDLAGKNVSVVDQFDSIYLAKVENIKTEQDRLDAIKALQQFLDNNPDHSDEMSRTFLDLKRDIAAFVDEFRGWVTAMGFFPSLVASIYQANIAALANEIAELDKQIQSGLSSLSMSGIYFTILDVSGSMGSIIIYILMNQRDEKKRSLKVLQDYLLALQQAPPLELLDKLDSWKPDLVDMFDRMVTMAEVWSSVRSQAIQFRVHIEGGLDAATNMRFKNEVKLARTVCAPMKEGLHRYIEGLNLYWN